MLTENDITNCHIHTFSSCDIPDKFLPFRLVRWLAKKDHPVFNWGLKALGWLIDNETLAKYVVFVKTGNKSQKDIYEECRINYPTGTRFIILPMDMTFMGCGSVPRKYYDQLEEISAQLDNTAIRFIHVDPRREDMINHFPFLHKSRGFRGMKLYPPLGYYPYDRKLFPFYAYCEKYHMPVISHGSPGNPVHFKGSYEELYQLLGIDGNDPKYKKLDKKELCAMFTHPSNYEEVLDRYPELNICIAHFGSVHWEKYMNNDFNDNWVDIIIKMIESHNNFWTDISYTMHDEKYWPMLKVLLITKPKLASRVLFGSDWYMNEVEDVEKLWSIKLRAYLGEDLFRQIAIINPRVFLKEQV